MKRYVEAAYSVKIEDKEEEFFDSVTGQPLVVALVREARKQELEYFRKWLSGSSDGAARHTSEWARHRSAYDG